MKRTIAKVLAIAMLFTLVVGCAKSADTGSKPSETAPAAGGEIKIGGLLELTGGVAEFGKKGENGIKLALKQQNDKGGLLGKKLVYVAGDTKSDAAEATNQATKLVSQDKVAAILGPMTSGNTLAAIPVVTDAKVPLITPTGTNEKVTIGDGGKLNPYIFRACFIDPFQGQVGANFALDTLKAKKAALLVDQKGDYAKGLADAFEKNFTAGGGEVVAKEKYVADQDQDFRATLTLIKSKNPDVIYVPGYYKEVSLAIKQAREMGMNQPFVGGDGWGSGPMVDVAGAANLNNTFYSDHVAADDPNLATFAKDYKAEYGSDPDSFAALGYDAANMLLQAIKDANSADGSKIRDALEKLTNFQGISGNITVDPATHNPVKSASILEFKDGKKVFKVRVDPKK